MIPIAPFCCGFFVDMSAPLILTERSPANPHASVYCTLELAAEDRVRSRHFFEVEGQPLLLQLPRGTVIQHGDLLTAATGELVRVIAKPEPVMTVTAKTPLELLRAAYHLGNRHIALEVTEFYLRLLPDSVLRDMLVQLGVSVRDEIVPFQPETGAYGHGQQSHHAHQHDNHEHHEPH
jgi:urease accessory protein